MDNRWDCFLSHSLLASDASPTAVAEIVKTSRVFNDAHGITGLLIFDGLRFCQYLEGPALPVQALCARIAADRRHVAMVTTYAAESIKTRLFSRWAVAYVAVDEAEPLQALRSLQGPSALAQFQAFYPHLDMA